MSVCGRPEVRVNISNKFQEEICIKNVSFSLYTTILSKGKLNTVNDKLSFKRAFFSSLEEPRASFAIYAFVSLQF